MKYDDEFHLFVFLGTIIFVGIFFGFTMFDMKSRDALNDEQETFVRWKEQENAGKGLVVGVDNVPERRARSSPRSKPTAAVTAAARHGGGHGGGEHKAEAKAEHKAAAH